MDRLGVKDSLKSARALLPVMAATADAREGMQAFREKRLPRWSRG
jgi:hypothetical protein